MAERTATVDASSLAALRVLFGCVLTIGAVEALVGPLVTELAGPRFHFAEWGFAWVPVPSESAVRGVLALLAALGIAIAAGFALRVSAVACLGLLLYLRVIESTSSLHHDGFTVLLLVLVALLPMRGPWSLDGRRRPSLRAERVPLAALRIVRVQVAIACILAALGKIGPDWLKHGQPMGLWLRAHDGTLTGRLAAAPMMPLAASWALFLFEATLVGWLLWRRSRPIAFAALLTLVTLTGDGWFACALPAAATVFFEPDWSRRGVERLRALWSALRARAGRQAFLAALRGPTSPAPAVDGAPLSRATVATVLLFFALQVLIPLRFLAYPGNPLWTEEGARFAWRTGLRDKQGTFVFRVFEPATGDTTEVNPATRLDASQLHAMTARPELAARFARHLADEELRTRGRVVEVRAEGLVSLNGRAPVPLIDASVDLARVHDGLAPKAWIRPAPLGPPAP